MAKEIKDDDPRWERLEKLWLEEGLQVKVKQLAERFGVSELMVARHLRNKFGTVSRSKYLGVKEQRF